MGCENAMSKGYTASGDPMVWRIVEDRLYVNYSKSVQQLFQKEPEARIKRADQNWPSLHN